MDKPKLLKRHNEFFEHFGWPHGENCFCKRIDNYFLTAEPEQPRQYARFPLFSEVASLDQPGVDSRRQMKKLTED